MTPKKLEKDLAKMRKEEGEKEERSRREDGKEKGGKEAGKTI